MISRFMQQPLDVGIEFESLDYQRELDDCWHRMIPEMNNRLNQENSEYGSEIIVPSWDIPPWDTPSDMTKSVCHNHDGFMHDGFMHEHEHANIHPHDSLDQSNAQLDYNRFDKIDDYLRMRNIRDQQYNSEHNMYCNHDSNLYTLNEEGTTSTSSPSVTSENDPQQQQQQPQQQHYSHLNSYYKNSVYSGFNYINRISQLAIRHNHGNPSTARQLIRPNQISVSTLIGILPSLTKQFQRRSRIGICRELKGKLYKDSPQPSPNFLINTLLPVCVSADILGFPWEYRLTDNLTFVKSWVYRQSGGKELLDRLRIRCHTQTSIPLNRNGTMTQTFDDYYHFCMAQR